MADQLIPTNQDISLVVHEIGDLLAAARSNVARQVNNELLSTYWNIGRIIAEYEQTVPERADYGKQTLKELSKALTNEFGKGFSVSNIQFMRRFYQTYQIQQTASVKLSWSHYCELLSISDSDKHSFYMYLNYYASEVNDPDVNLPIGIILCTEKDSITAEYALGGLSNNVFASRYVLYIPNKEQLIAQVEAVLEKRKENGNES